MESKHKSKNKSIDIKTENAIFNKITTVFRFVEMFFFLVIIISGFSSQLPSAVKLAGDYLIGNSFTVLSPKFVFVIGNLIVLILFLRSRVVENTDEVGNADLSYGYVKSCSRSVVNCTDVTSAISPANVGVVSSNRKISRSKSEDPMSVKCRDDDDDDDGSSRKLRRSVTEMDRGKNSGEGDKAAVKEELSCEDFRRTVEAFIARQQKILRDEEFCPVVCVNGL